MEDLTGRYLRILIPPYFRVKKVETGTYLKIIRDEGDGIETVGLGEYNNYQDFWKKSRFEGNNPEFQLMPIGFNPKQENILQIIEIY